MIVVNRNDWTMVPVGTMVCSYNRSNNTDRACSIGVIIF